MQTVIHRPYGMFLLLALAAIVAAAPAKPVVVTITKTDGTTVRGQLGDVDPTTINVTPIAKPGTSAEAVRIPWDQIKTVSNGLTQRKVIEFWKRDHPEDVCSDCHGDGKVLCATCKGTGRDPAQAKDCPTCHGAETVPCTTPKCDHGKIPCPKPHLKLTEGVWRKQDDGLRWRSFPSSSGGSMTVSERHLGQIVEMKDGVPQPPADCPLCRNTMIIDDPKCGGTGAITCNACSAAAMKDATQKCKDCEKGQIACKACDGTGLKSLGKPQ